MKYIIGIDEVGRGPLAGPVTVGVVLCESSMYTKLKKLKTLPPRGKDSKKLKVVDREKYSKILQKFEREGRLKYSVVHISNTIIDSRGLSFAIKKAMSEGLKKVQRTLKIDPKKCEILLDGGLKAPAEFTHQKTIIKGDEKEQIIAWASILAKVSRDAVMCGFHVKYPTYGFADHKGYGTLSHRNKVILYGLSKIHRRSFCKKLL